MFNRILTTQVTAGEESLPVPGFPALKLTISLLPQVGGLLTPGWALGG